MGAIHVSLIADVSQLGDPHALVPIYSTLFVEELEDVGLAKKLESQNTANLMFRAGSIDAHQDRSGRIYYTPYQIPDGVTVRKISLPKYDQCNITVDTWLFTPDGYLPKIVNPNGKVNVLYTNIQIMHLHTYWNTHGELPRGIVERSHEDVENIRTGIFEYQSNVDHTLHTYTRM